MEVTCVQQYKQDDDDEDEDDANDEDHVDDKS